MAKGSKAVWEIRPGVGSDTSGGAFDATISGAGTDYSQQDAPQLTVSDGVENGTTTITSATGGFTAAMIGNALYDGTDRFFITDVASGNSITVDRATGSGSDKTLNVGGALTSLTEAFSGRGGIGSNTFWAKGGMQTVSVALTPPSGARGQMTVVAGYADARGDLDSDAALYADFPIIQTSNSTNYIFDCSNASQVYIKNFCIDGGTGASKAARGCSIGINSVTVEHCVFTRINGYGVVLQANESCVKRCYATACTGTAAFYQDQAGEVVLCAAIGNSVPGFYCYNGTFCRCVAASNNGSSSDGFYHGLSSSTICHCVSYGNLANGFSFSNADGRGIDVPCDNLIAYNNGQYGFKLNLVSAQSPDLLDYNALGSNTSGDYSSGLSAGPHDVSLSADPFENPTGAITCFADILANFALNDNAGAGALCRAAGYPPFLDIGALQHQDSGGGGGSGGGSPFVGIIGGW